MSKMSIDEELIRKLADLLHEKGLGEIEVEDGDRRVRLAVPQPQAVAMASYAAAPPPGASAAPVIAATAAPAVDDASHPGAIKSPMVGTAYLSPEPGKPHFVAVGDKVAAGTTLLIIEAMKTFNPIKSPKAGTVVRIVVDNAQAVEFGEVLMIVE